MTSEEDTPPEVEIDDTTARGTVGAVNWTANEGVCNRCADDLPAGVSDT